MNSVKSTADGDLLTVLHDAISTALKQWLDQNRAEFLRMAREAMLNNNTGQRGAQQPTQSAEFLTVIDVAQRWRLLRADEKWLTKATNAVRLYHRDRNSAQRNPRGESQIAKG